MAEQPAQSFANHTRWVPMYHFVAFGILTVNIFWKLYHLIRWPSFGSAMEFLVAFAIALIAFYARVFALAAQDRVIRNEERDRLTRLLPADQRARIADFKTGQLVALRFASDEELPSLAAKVLTGELPDQKSIKQQIKVWRPDYQRA